MSWWKKISKFFGMITVRNRDARGRYVADDPSTPIKEQPLVIKRPSTPKPKSLSREDTSIFEKERIDEVAIHEYALNDEYDLNLHLKDFYFPLF